MIGGKVRGSREEESGPTSGVGRGASLPDLYEIRLRGAIIMCTAWKNNLGSMQLERLASDPT